jgi:hypothetical protein
MERSDEGGGSIGKCLDLIAGIHSEDSVQLYADLATVVEEVVAHFQ